MDILEFVDNLEPNLSNIKGDLRKIADLHISFYKFYIRFASRCEALIFDKKSRNYLESCIDFLQNKKLSAKAIRQSRSNLIKMLDFLNDLCVSLGGDKRMLSKIYMVIDQAVVDDSSEDTEKGETGGALDLLKQLKNLLNDPADDGDASGMDEREDMDEEGPMSPANSTGSSTPEHEEGPAKGGVQTMAEYLLSDEGVDNSFYLHAKELEKRTMICRMNETLAKLPYLREIKYTGLDNMIAKMKINVPIWNYNIDRVDTIDTNNVMENMEIFKGNKTVIDAVLYSCPDFVIVGPFEVYIRNKVFVYHCLLNNCNDCMTTSLEFLTLHVKFNHGKSEIDWNCSGCELVNIHSASQRSLDGALDHLAKFHSIKSTYTLSKERLMEINQSIANKNFSLNVCPAINLDEDDNGRNEMDLFYCPFPGCEFSTNSLTLAFCHFTSISDSSFKFECRYCSLILYRNYDFCEHLMKQHGNANYRCGYCSYRTVSKTNSVFHLRDKHSDLPRKILACEPINREFVYDCRAHNSLKPFTCYESCGFSSLIEQKFTSHLLEHAGSTMTCRHCSEYETNDISELRDHLLLHGVGEYHCLYCKEAFNFILKVERHLHEKHSSRYPFIVISQDFDSRSHSLKGKYNKIQKLDIGTESIIVVALESDRSVSTVSIISASESIIVEDIDHCKMQLKHFMKNTCEKPTVQAKSPFQSPHILETLDLTEGEDPRERVDIKPRIRLRNIEQLMRSSTLISFDNNALDSSSPSENAMQPLQSSFNVLESGNALQNDTAIPPPRQMLTPAQIKEEKVSGPNNEGEERQVERSSTDESAQSRSSTGGASNPNVQVKRERSDVSSKSIPPKSPAKKLKTSSKTPASEAVRIKQEGLESQGELTIDEGPFILSIQTWDDNEDNSAAAAIAQRDESETESDIPPNQLSIASESSTPPNQRSNESSSIPPNQLSIASESSTPANPLTNASISSIPPDHLSIGSESSTPANPLTNASISSIPPNQLGIIAPLDDIAMETPNNTATGDGAVRGGIDVNESNTNSTSAINISQPVNEIVINPNGEQFEASPILNEASIRDIPVDFDCEIPQQVIIDQESADVKTFGINDAGNLVIRPIRYKDPTIVDTVIISDGEDDDDTPQESLQSAATSPGPRSLSNTPSTSSSPIPPPFSAVQLDVAGQEVTPVIVSSHSVTPGTEAQPVASTEATIVESSLKISSTSSLWVRSQGTDGSGATYYVIDASQTNSVHQKVVLNEPSSPLPPQVLPKMYRCKLCNFTSEDRQVTHEHLYSAHPSKLSEHERKRKINSSHKISGDILIKGVSCPYCSDKVYEGVKSFERHHAAEHGDFSEVKCFILYPPNNKQHLNQVLACSFCGTFCLSEEAIWKHTWSLHTQRMKLMRKPFRLKAIIAMKKMVCPLYNCLEEFLQPQSFRLHMLTHTTVIACKTCTYIADTPEAFHAFHNELDPIERLMHFYYYKNEEEIGNLVNIQRFSNPLYSLNSVLLDEDTKDKKVSTHRKTTARKSTGGTKPT